MNTIKLALDWRPNTNHTGFFVAQHLGYYDDVGLRVDIISTEVDNYQQTPAKKLELGMVDFALCPMESLLSYRTKSNPLSALAIGTVFQEDISALCTLKSGGLNSPAALDHKIYASYNARYEDRMVAQMVRNDGGKGAIKTIYPDKLGIWNTLLTGQADATWIFVNWEGVEAEAQNIDLNLFKMSDFGIPYGYSPIIMTTEERIMRNAQPYRKFMAATKRGFQYASTHYENSALILAEYISESDKCIDLEKSQIMTSPSYGNPETWGHMNLNKMQNFLDWLHKYNLEKQHLKAKDIASNQFFT